MKNFPTVAIRILTEIALLVFVFQNAHLSVFITLAVMTLSIEMLSLMLSILLEGIKALREIQAQDRKDFDEFVATLNSQADAFKKQMSVCKECELHGQHGVRPGSIHNKAADNCLMKDKPTQP